MLYTISSPVIPSYGGTAFNGAAIKFKYDINEDIEKINIRGTFWISEAACTSRKTPISIMTGAGKPIIANLSIPITSPTVSITYTNIKTNVELWLTNTFGTDSFIFIS